MNRTAFFAAVRKDPFGGSLGQAQVDGLNAILDSCLRNKVADKNHVANILAQVYHETGTHMLPIKETVMPYHKDKNPSDATVIARLNAAFAKGQLGKVKTPYWRDGWFGRGPIQITHRDNYLKLGKRLGVDLVGNPNLALDPKVGSDIAVVGMSEGLFRSDKSGPIKLSRFSFPTDLDAKPVNNPRRIVNGSDGTDAKIAGYHRSFLAALSDWSLGVAPSAPQPPPEPPAKPPVVEGFPMPERPPVAKSEGWLAVLLRLLARLFGRK